MRSKAVGPFGQRGGVLRLLALCGALRLAPYRSGAFGFLLASSTKEDVSGFEFHKRFALTPSLGTRIFLADRLFLRLEVRSPFWSVSYPDSYRVHPSSDPTQPPVLAAP